MHGSVKFSNVGVYKKSCLMYVCQGLRLRKILRILRINIRLWIYTKAVRFVYGKIWCKNPPVNIIFKEKRKKKAQAMTSFLKAWVNMPTLGVTCTSFLIACALIHSGACCPGRGGGIWLWCFTRQRALMILCRSNSFLPGPSDWLAMYDAQNKGQSTGPCIDQPSRFTFYHANLVFDVATFSPSSSLTMVHGNDNSILSDRNRVRLSFYE